jgi:hypothetical protein
VEICPLHQEVLHPHSVPQVEVVEVWVEEARAPEDLEEAEGEDNSPFFLETILFKILNQPYLIP